MQKIDLNSNRERYEILSFKKFRTKQKLFNIIQNSFEKKNY